MNSGIPDRVVAVHRLSARARLDESPAALLHAKARADSGDESWEQWLAEYRAGDALILRLELTLEITGDGNDVLTISKDGFFVENHAHTPKVERQIAELASSDFAAMAGELAGLGHDVDMQELGAMYVHVELDPGVRRRLADRRARRRGAHAPPD
jgi:hypothetical protein